MAATVQVNVKRNSLTEEETVTTGTSLDFLKIGHRFPAVLKFSNGQLVQSKATMGEVYSVTKFGDMYECLYQVTLGKDQLKPFLQYTLDSIVVNFGEKDDSSDVPLKRNHVITDGDSCVIVKGVINFTYE